MASTPKGIRVDEAYRIAKIGEVSIEEIEEALAEELV